MTDEAAAIPALEAALLADPTAAVVRRHLVTLLVQSGEGQRALEHCDVLMEADPTDAAVLHLAAQAADVAGQPGRARTYRALAGQARSHEPPAAPTASDAAPDEVFGDEIDQFLRDVLRANANQRIMLDDVGGLVDVKRQLDASFLAPIRHPELRMAYGKDVRGGLLLWGPPGCGKTYLARAIAGELGASFIPVAVHDVLDMWLGNSERNLHRFFQAARRKTPSVLFFDEVDSLGYSRARQRTGAGLRGVVTELLTELDGVEAANDGVYVLAATNQLWDVDPALRRPGRFDRSVLVLPPDRSARRAIFFRHLRDRPVDTVDADRLADRSDGLTGADIRLVCETALEFAFAEAQASGELRPVTQAHLERALGTVRSSATPWLDAARSYVTYANESGEYDELGAYLKQRRRR